MELQRKLNIAFVCDPVTDYTAGSFISTLRFAELLKERGHNVIFIAAKSPSSPKNNEYKGMRVYRFSSLLLPKTEHKFYLAFPSGFQLKRIFKKEKIDVVHIILPTPACVLAARIAKKMKISVISHSHSQPENVFLHIPKPLTLIMEPLNKVYYWYMTWIYQHAKVIIYPTEFAKKYFTGINAIRRTEVISNGVDTSKFKAQNPTEFQTKHGVNPSNHNVLFVGRLHPEKSISTVIKAVKQIAEVDPLLHLYIVGGGHEKPKLKVLAEEIKVSDRVHFLGMVSNEDLIASYSACQVFVLPSLAELEGMVVLEAMACGAPILIANSPASAATHFVKNNGMLFEPENVDDLAQKIKTMLANPTQLKQMGEASRQQALQYDIHTSVEKLEAVYFSVVQ